MNEVALQSVTTVDQTLSEVPRGAADEFDRRSNRLARALRSAGVSGKVTVAVVVCDDGERLVALTAIEKMGAVATEIPCGLTPAEFAMRYRASGATATLACTEGTQTWLAAGVGGLILGDGAGVRWWKLGELRESSDPLC